MDPKKTHPDLTDCELRSLAHVNPDENLDEDEFYFEHAGEHPTMEEFRAAQNPSGYPLRTQEVEELPRSRAHQVIHDHSGIPDARN